jgi:4,5-dihydroxyphthalate decarboxylase
MSTASKLSLSLCVSKNPRTTALLSGAVAPEGVEWSVSGVHPSEMFWRQLKFSEFDVSEMSLSSLTIAASQGMTEWTALPIFTTRRFFHTMAVVREGAGIESPADLVGKRVGVPEYQQTAAVWARGALLHEFGVEPTQMKWFMERPPERSHGGSTSFTPPPGLELSYVPPTTTLGQMMAAGELDASIHYITDRNLVDRSREEASSIGVRTLFADPVAEGARYYEKTGLLPVNHCVVIRSALVEKHPWLPLNVYSAFLQAKEAAYAPLAEDLQPWEQIGAVSPESMHNLRKVDPLPYGLADNQAVLEALPSYLHEQGLIDRPFDVREIFAPSTRDL